MGHIRIKRYSIKLAKMGPIILPAKQSSKK
jgi:hypothetical protein